MKVPENIKKAINECAEFNERAKFCEREIIKYMEAMKITEETARCPEKNLDDTFIDYCLITNNPEKFIEVIENL